MEFVRNRGQWYDRIAYVAQVEGALQDQYHGCGRVTVVVDGNACPVSIHYEGDHPGETGPGFYVIEAMASAYELVVEAGTASAAVLTALIGERNT